MLQTPALSSLGSGAALGQRGLQEFLSYVFQRIKEIEEFLHFLDEELSAFIKRVDQPGFEDVLWRDQMLLHFGLLSLHWERQWMELALLLKEYGLLAEDTEELKTFRRMKSSVILESFEMDCKDRSFPSPRHLALKHEGEQDLDPSLPGHYAVYTGGVALKRCSTHRSPRRHEHQLHNVVYVDEVPKAEDGSAPSPNQKIGGKVLVRDVGCIVA